MAQARGKSGPLFHFDVHEDVRLENDARVEKDESHAGKVVERHWYNRCRDSQGRLNESPKINDIGFTRLTRLRERTSRTPARWWSPGV